MGVGHSVRLCDLVLELGLISADDVQLQPELSQGAFRCIGLRARRSHTVSIEALELDVAFEEGEPLRVEISSKFRRERFEVEAGRAGLLVESWWTDRAGDFALALLRRK